MPALSFPCPICRGDKTHRRDRIPEECWRLMIDRGIGIPEPPPRPERPDCPTCGRKHSPSRAPAACRRGGEPPPYTFHRRDSVSAVDASGQTLPGGEWKSKAHAMTTLLGWRASKEAVTHAAYVSAAIDWTDPAALRSAIAEAREAKPQHAEGEPYDLTQAAALIIRRHGTLEVIEVRLV